MGQRVVVKLRQFFESDPCRVQGERDPFSPVINERKFSVVQLDFINKDLTRSGREKRNKDIDAAWVSDDEET